MGDGNEAATCVSAEIGDPAVVGPAVRLRELDVINFGLPKYSDGRVEDGLSQMLRVQEIEALLSVHRSEGCTPNVSPFRTRPQLVSLAPHAAEKRKESGRRLPGDAPVVFEALQPSLVLD